VIPGSVGWIVEPNVHPCRSVRAPRACNLAVLLLLASQEADLVSLPCDRQQCRMQCAPCADDLVPKGRVQARNGAGDQMFGDPVI